jgi:hypothetical protein
MGRQREAFGLVAGRCAAADIETLRQIREQKQAEAPLWAECCTLDLHVARRSVDRKRGSQNRIPGGIRPSGTPAFGRPCGTM